jgi:hypothetical protein
VEEAVHLKQGASVNALRILLPNGTEEDVALDESGSTFLDTHIPGIYTITALPGEYTEQFAVNIFSNVESGIAPRQEVLIAGPNNANSAQTPQQMGLINLWQLPAALALGLLVIEWWLYFRRPLPSWILGKIPTFLQRDAH